MPRFPTQSLQLARTAQGRRTKTSVGGRRGAAQGTASAAWSNAPPGVPMSALDLIPPAGRRWTYGQLLLGIAAHDAYHVGQIQLMKRLWEERKVMFR